MAINSQALLPQSTQKSANIGKDLVKVNRTVIKLNKFFKKSNVQKRKELQQDRRKKAKEKREREEERLENLKDENRDLKFKLNKYEPKLGFIGSIKRFIGNAILGFFAVKFLDQLPKLRSFLGFVSSATSFIADIGVGLVDGLASFIDFGYKAFEGTKKLLGDIGGNNVTELFDGIIDKVSTMIDVLIVASLVAGKNIFDRFGDPDDFNRRGRRGRRGRGPGGIGGRFKIPQLPSLPTKAKDIKGLKKGSRLRGQAVGRGAAAASRLSSNLKSSLARESLSKLRKEKSNQTISRGNLKRFRVNEELRLEERRIEIKKRRIANTQRQISEELITAGYAVGNGGQPTPRDGSILRRLAREDDPNKIKSLKNNLSSAKNKRKVSSRQILDTIGREGPVTLGRSKGARVTPRIFEAAEYFARQGTESSAKAANTLLSKPGSPESRILLKKYKKIKLSERDIFRRAIKPEGVPSVGQSSTKAIFSRIKGARGAVALESLFAALDFYERTQEGQTTKQAAAGAVAGGVGGATGFSLATSVAAKLLSPLLVAPIPGARILYGGLVLGAGIAGSLGLSGVTSGVADRITGVTKTEGRNEGGLIKGDLVRSTDREYQRGVSVKKVPDPSQIKLDINTDKTYKEQVYQLDKIDFFGPIMALAGKILVGQTPDSSDYKNVGLGYAALIQRASIDGVLTGTPAFQGGGAVNLMSRVGQGIANWVAETVRGVIINPIKNISTLFDGKINKGRLPVYVPPFELPSAPPPLTQPPAISEEKDTGGTFTGTMNRDLAALVAISALESGSAQGRADVAQSIYNRLGDPGKAYGKSLFSIVTADAQYQPAYTNPNVSSGPGTKTSAEFLNITDRSSAITAMMSYYRKRNKKVSRQQAAKDFDDTLAAISNKQRQESAAEMVGGRTEFLGAGVPIHRLDQAEVRTRGGVFDNQFFEAYGTGGDENLKIQQGAKSAPKGLFADQSSTPTEKLISFRPKDLSGIQSYPSYDSMSSETIIINRNQIMDQQVAAAPQESAPIIIPVFRDDPFESLDFVG
jgi:hypothetical protein